MDFDDLLLGSQWCDALSTLELILCWRPGIFLSRGCRLGGADIGIGAIPSYWWILRRPWRPKGHEAVS